MPLVRLSAKRKKKTAGTRDENKRHGASSAGSGSKGTASTAAPMQDVAMSSPQAESSADAQLRVENERLKQVRG